MHKSSDEMLALSFAVTARIDATQACLQAELEKQAAIRLSDMRAKILEPVSDLVVSALRSAIASEIHYKVLGLSHLVVSDGLTLLIRRAASGEILKKYSTEVLITSDIRLLENGHIIGISTEQFDAARRLYVSFSIANNLPTKL